MTFSRGSSRQLQLGSSSDRVGCDLCFRTLDPNLADDLNRAFTRCLDCKRNYHQLHAASRCPICGSDQIAPLSVTAPRPLPIEPKRPTILEPLQRLPQTGKTEINLGFTAYIASLRHGLRLLPYGLLTILFITIAAAIGAYTYRWTEIISLHSRRPELSNRLVNAVLREPLPRTVVFQMTVLAGAVTAYALFHFTARTKHAQSSVLRWLWRIVGGGILLLAANILLFDIDILNGPPISIIVTNLLNRSTSREIIFGQIGAIVTVTILSIPYLIIARNPPLPPSYPRLLNMLWFIGSLARYLVIFYLMICLAVSVGITQLSGTEGLIFNFLPARLNNPTDAEAREMMIALTALATGLLLYQISSSRIKALLSRPLNIMIRLLGSLFCLGLAAFLYQQSEANFLIEAAVLGAGLALLLLPTQKAYA